MFTSIEWSGITQSIHSVKAEESQKETKTVEQKEVIKSEKQKILPPLHLQMVRNKQFFMVRMLDLKQRTEN